MARTMWVVLRWLRLRSTKAARDLLHPKGGRAKRTRRRVATISAVGAGLASVAAFPDSTERVAARLCRVPVAQPALADRCGALGIAGLATRQERVFWEGMAMGDCDALRLYLNRFPEGVYGELAERRLSMRRIVRAEQWSETRREVQNYLRQTAQAFASEGAAVADARLRAVEDARQMVGCTAHGRDEVLLKVDLAEARPSCHRSEGGYVCGLDYRAQCTLRTRAQVVRCG